MSQIYPLQSIKIIAPKLFPSEKTIIIDGAQEGQHTKLRLIPAPGDFISRALNRISWELRDTSNISRDYEHFSCPFLLSVGQVYGNIRNLKYRYFAEVTLVPEEAAHSDPFILCKV